MDLNKQKMAQERREWILEPNQEFRFEVDVKSVLTLKLLEGKAELFGSELALDVEYQFTARKLAIFTYHGCKIESSGSNISEYIGKETPMSSIINVHFALQRLREEAQTNDTLGPRVMIVGPSDVGKTALAKILVNYAARGRKFPILCDIDPNGVTEGFNTRD
jgi:polyribonucleotide 5'-hydroxyl-kinase